MRLHKRTKSEDEKLLKSSFGGQWGLNPIKKNKMKN